MAPVERFAAEWNINTKFLESLGVNPNVLGKTVQIDHGVGRIAGLKASNRKFPFIVTYQNGTKARKMNLKAFQEVLRQNSLV